VESTFLCVSSCTLFGFWLGLRTPRCQVDSDDFRLAISLVLVFTCILIPSLAPHNQILLLPAYLLLVKERKRIWVGGRIARSLWLAAWLTVVGALLATTLVFDRASSRLWDLPLATNPVIPITVFAALQPLLVRKRLSTHLFEETGLLK
jgi:hypothetical protein